MQTAAKIGGGVLGGFLFCVITTLILSFTLITLRQNYGDDALPGLLVWTVPFSMAATVVGLLLGWIIERWQVIWRLLMAFALASAASMLTVQFATAWLWGSWVRGLGFPVELIWIPANWLTLIGMMYLGTKINTPLREFMAAHPLYGWIAIFVTQTLCLSIPFVLFSLFTALNQ